MQFAIWGLSLAITAPFASAYPVIADTLNCRDGPSSSNKYIRAYSQNTDLKITCQVVGESINGHNLWDKTSDGCYVSDYYVKTGTSQMVTKECSSGGSPSGGTSGGSSSINSKIKRSEIIARGQYWVSRHVPYSMSATYPDSKGTRYRTDCSGFVTMALHASAPGYNTVSLPQIAKSISWNDLKPGDFVGTLGPGTAGAAGHVTLFHSWADSGRKNYNTLECRGTYGCVAYKRPVAWKDGPFTAKPYRYIHVED